MRASVCRFFDITPLGRLLNHFSGDMEVIDEELPGTLDTLCSYGASAAIAMATIHASLTISHQLYGNLLHLPTEFFDITPSGRILDRCTSDVQILDTIMPLNMRIFMSTMFQGNNI
ncbi:unnamed protein product [Ceratitis capitata]|uniref:(Mediterranean fruit fly) hypothetical protein n=1 Tax=Ceratitis capitata TaxID=7213 RepID=A0A811UPJ6_CERCA|nr:unnamed protein product [Ceratitis capitata]